MSARDRAQKEAAQDEQRFIRNAMNGLRQTLATEEGRAFLWWFYARVCMVESEHAKRERRAVGVELANAAKLASFGHWQVMRDENERPKHAARDDEAPEEAAEE